MLFYMLFHSIRLFTQIMKTILTLFFSVHGLRKLEGHLVVVTVIRGSIWQTTESRMAGRNDGRQVLSVSALHCKGPTCLSENFPFFFFFLSTLFVVVVVVVL